MTEQPPTLSPDQQVIRDRCFHPTGAFVEFPLSALDGSLVERFEKQVELHPERLAVISGCEKSTYEELNSRANRIAYEIVEKSDDKQEAVAILLDHGISAVAAMLGVLKAGKTFVPMDATHPSSRLRHIVENCEARLLVTDDLNVRIADDLTGGKLELVTIGDFAENISVDNPGIRVQPQDIAFFVYTSGSTGRPKGIIQSHRNFIHAIRSYTNALHLCSDDRLTLLYSYSVAGGIRDTFRALLNGASLHLWNIRTQGMNGLSEWLVDQRITVYNSVILVFREFAGTLTGDEAFPNLRLIAVGGETIYDTDVDLYRKYFGAGCVFIDRYGLTETETVSIYFIDDRSRIEEARVPIGHASEEYEILVLNDYGEPVDQGETGEIAIRSRYLSLGYWRLPELTQARFLSDSEDPRARIFLTGDLGRTDDAGRTVVLGHKDAKVNIRGYLVETSEIEGALLRADQILAAAVAMKGERPEDQRLVAYLVTTPGSRINLTKLRESLGDVLPGHMIPATFMVVGALPVLATGKTDRLALPEPGRERPELEAEFIGPGTPVEVALAEIWSQVLDIDQIGIHDGFLELGGDSLKATRIVSRVISTFRAEVPLTALFDSPTVVEMALVVVVVQHRAAATSEDRIDTMLSELEAMSDEQVGLVSGGRDATPEVAS